VSESPRPPPASPSGAVPSRRPSETSSRSGSLRRGVRAVVLEARRTSSFNPISLRCSRGDGVAVVPQLATLSESAEVLRALRGARRAVEPEHLRARVAAQLGRSGHAILRPLERRARDLGEREQDGVRRIERDVAIEVDEWRAGRARRVRARVRRVLRGGLAARECVCAQTGGRARTIWCVPTLIHATRFVYAMFSLSKNLSKS
jgi:hypothetical protein